MGLLVLCVVWKVLENWFGYCVDWNDWIVVGKDCLNGWFWCFCCCCFEEVCWCGNWVVRRLGCEIVSVCVIGFVRCLVLV